VLAVLTLFAYPFLVAIGAEIFLGERLTPVSATIVLVGSLGVALSVGVGGHATSVGLAYGAASAFLFAVSFLLIKPILATVLDGISLTAIFYGGGVLIFLPVGVITNAALPHDSVGWVAAVAAAVIGTAVGSVCLFSGMRHLSAGVASMLGIVEPPLAVALAAIALAEPVAVSQILGMVIVMFAVAALSYGLVRPKELPSIHESAG
jgi:drug/metabolite transporter (DMT)-like permease